MPHPIPMLSKQKKKQRPKRKKKSLAEAVGLKTTPSPGKQERPSPPSSQMPEEKPRKRSLAGTLAQAAAAMPGRGRIGGIIKSSLAGASAGAGLERAYKDYKAKRASKRAKKAKTTVSQSAMAQKAKYHKKDETGTEKL